jgi:hypothetical protein
MRILSSFKDYYDCIQKYGEYSEPLYNRENQVFTTFDPTFRTNSSYNDGKPFFRWPIKKDGNLNWLGGETCTLNNYQWLVGFAGKLYPLIRYSSVGLAVNCYTIAEVDFAIEEYGDKKEKKDYNSGYTGLWCGFTRKNCERFFDTHSKLDVPAFFEEYPIFVAARGEIVFNAYLSNIEFYKVLDAYTAFQELEMWFGKKAFPEKTIPAVSDKDMAAAKGFDKFSFRKDKSK